ncbi:NYN domain-containing protein [Salinicoccus roseus]|uniref:NYN domain-containing protein n=1 Tax=Salinicoccus roseus TaxID=45670 RepID=UPI003523AD53
MKKVAIVVDGQFLMHRYREAKRMKLYPSAEEQYEFLVNILTDEEEELFRIFYYQGSPNKQEVEKPISKDVMNFSNSDIHRFSTEMIETLAVKDYIAMRLGETQFRGWKLKAPVMQRIRNGDIKDTTQLTDYDFVPDFQQKGVDIKIGLDVAWLSNNSIVDRIYMITGDADFVPALKHARREGIQIKLIKIGTKRVHENLEKHSDYIVEIKNEDV